MEVKDEQIVIKNNIREIFKSAQITAAAHQRAVINLTTILGKSDQETFFTALRKTLNHILCCDYKQKNVYVERLMEFVAKFSGSLKPTALNPEESTQVDFIEHPVFIEILDYLLQTQALESDIIRFRSCQMINKILDQLIGMDISNLLCEQIEEALLERLKDQKKVIRLQAVIALHRLQDPRNSDDKIIPQFIHLMKCDSFAKVRELCVEKIAIRKDVLREMLVKTRDIDVSVRLAAFKRLSKQATLIKIVDKRLIVKCGFLDQSPKIVEYMSEMMVAWMDSYNNNVFELLKALRLDADEKDIKETTVLFEYVLGALFPINSLKDLSNMLPINGEKLIPFDKLNWEVVSFWRIYVQFLSKNEEYEDELNGIVPELVYFCRYIKQYHENVPNQLSTTEFLESQFILSQLFLITKTYDFADTVTRQCLNNLVKHFLEKIVLTADVIKVIVNNLERTIPPIESRCKFVSEIISEIIYPMDANECEKENLDYNFKMSQLKVKMVSLSEEQQQAIKTEDFTEAGRLKHEMEAVHLEITNLKNFLEQREHVQEKCTDIPTIVKYLDIAIALLLSPQIMKPNPVLQSLKNEIIQDSLIHDNDSVKAKAFHCYALFCLIDKKSAQNGINIFSIPISAYQAGEECDSQLLLVCIKAVVDLIRIYGSKLVAEPDDNEDDQSESRDEKHLEIFAGGTSLTGLIQGLVDLMDDEQLEIQETAGCGLCALVLGGRVNSASLISRLVLKWCNPALEESEKLKRIIGVTLEKLPCLPDSAEQLEGAVLITIKTLVNAPRSSPLADVNIENIAKFLVALCRTSIEGTHIHSNLALSLCCEMKNKPRSRANVIYSKMLLMLIIPDDKLIVRDLLKFCDEIRDDVHDRIAINNIIKLITILKQKELDFKDVVVSEVIEEDNENIQESQEV